MYNTADKHYTHRHSIGYKGSTHSTSSTDKKIMAYPPTLVLHTKTIVSQRLIKLKAKPTINKRFIKSNSLCVNIAIKNNTFQTQQCPRI